MIIPTHRLVGRQLYFGLDAQEQEKLVYRRFVWGNVKPDVKAAYKRVSHYHPANERFVFDLLDRAFFMPLDRAAYSDLLGVLIHFLCDYTCIYHNNMRLNADKSMRQHLQYECLLHVYTQLNIRRYEPEVLDFSCVEDVKYHIWAVIRRANLDGMIPDMKADFEAMMQMSVSVVRFMLKNRV